MRIIQRKRNIILYAISGLGVNLMNTIMGSYLCSALLVGGFGQDVIKYQTLNQTDIVIPAAWAVFVFVARIIDGVIDIPMASFADNLQTRWGRRKPAIFIGLILSILVYALFLYVPNPNEATILNTVYFGVLLCAFYSCYTLTMVTYYATFTEIVDNSDSRNMLSNTKSVFDIVYFLIGYVLVRALLNGNNIRIVALMMLPLSLTMLIPMFMIKEDGTNQEQQSEIKEKVTLFKSLKSVMGNKVFVVWMMVFSFMTFGLQLFLSGINEYFSYVGINMIFVMGMAFMPVPFTLILYNKVMKKHGFVTAFKYVLLSFVIAMLVLFISGMMESEMLKNILSVTGGLFASVAMGAVFSVSYSVPSQIAFEEGKNDGIKNSAMYFATQGLFSGVATGIGSGLVLTALKGSQSAESGYIVYMPLISATGFLISFVLLSTAKILKDNIKL